MLLIQTTGLDDYLDGGSGRIKALIMGAPGSGKTVHGAQWPRPLLADCEEGRMSVAAQHIPYVAIKTVAIMKELLTMAEEEGKRPLDKQRFQTLIIDTLDSYQRLVIREYLVANKKASMSGWQDWGHLDAEMTELVSRLNLLPMNVVVNLHIKETKVGENDEGEGGYLVKGPKLKGDLREQISAEFDLVGYLEAGWEVVNGKRAITRYIQWGASPDKPLAKDRSRVLPDRTPVTGTPEDFQTLQRPLLAALAELKQGEVIMEVATPEPPTEPEPVTKGGPVESGATPAPVAKKAAAKKTAAAKPATKPTKEEIEHSSRPAAMVGAPTHGVAAPAPKVTTPAPAVAKPVPTPVAVPVTPEEGVAAIEEVLGGEVITPEEPQIVIEAMVPDPAQEAQPAVEPPILATPVDTPSSSIPDNQMDVSCGDRRFIGVEAAAWPTGFEPCGQDMSLITDGNRFTEVLKPEGQRPDLVEIGALKTRAILCNSCFAAHRNATKK